MNPRYLAYCRSQGHPDPDVMLKVDNERWPGGIMCGFILWMSDQWSAFEKQHLAKLAELGGFPIGRVTANDRGAWRLMNADAFDVWLQAEYPTLARSVK